MEAAERKGRPLPAWYLEKPPSAPGDAWWLSAFFELSTERPLGMSPGPVPWSSVIRYGSWHGLSEAMIGVLLRVVRVLDAVYLAWCQKQQEQRLSMRQAKGQGRA